MCLPTGSLEPLTQTSPCSEAAINGIPADEIPYFELIREWIHTRTGLHYPERKYLLLYPRLKKLCWRLSLDNLKELYQHLQAHDVPGLAVEVAQAVSTNHTYFLREQETLQFFQEKIIPTLPVNEPWRIWSAAAASGEEAYSLAILLTELLGLDQQVSQIAILGTDLSQLMIQRAEQGIYDERRLELLPDYLKKRYFKPLGLNQWRIDPRLKQLCTFRRLNLMSHPWPFKNPFHVVLCRNVLYYFDRLHQQTLLERVYDETVPGGWLITSVTESLWGMNTPWRPVCSGVYRKRID